MKKIIFFIIIISIGVALLYLVLGNPSKKQTPQQTNRQVVVPTLVPAKALVTIPSNTNFSYVGNKAFPNQLPIFSVSQAPSSDALRQEAEKYSTVLGFSTVPSVATIKSNFIYTREQPPQYFTYTKTLSTTALTYQNDEAKPQNKTAESFIETLNFFHSPFSLVYLGVNNNNMEGVGVADIPSPVLTKHLFGLSLQGVPVYTHEYSPSWAFIITDDSSRVRMATLVAPYSLDATTKSVSLISPKDAVANLGNGGALLGVSNPSGDYFDPSITLSSGTVTDFSIAYVFQDNALVPAYILRGTGAGPDKQTREFNALILASTQ